MGRRIEAPGGIWLVRLHGCADRLRHRVYISRPTPPLEREATERHDGEQTAQQCEGDSESGGLRLELGGHERDHETNDRRREPDRQRSEERRVGKEWRSGWGAGVGNEEGR